MDASLKPAWLNKKIRLAECAPVERLLSGLGLHTVCQEASCPNRGECFSRSVATFLILGKDCTRSCTFCGVSRETPQEPDPLEPERLSQAVQALHLQYVVVTSVTRDDLPDGGASVFAATIRRLRRDCPATAIELLIPDFRLDPHAIKTVVSARPDLIAHNVETVPGLYPQVRPDSDYLRSLSVLRMIREQAAGMPSKSGLMLGLGESLDDVRSVFDDLRSSGVNELTLGQYLAPTGRHHPVREYVHPDVFAALKQEALSLGFTSVQSGPYVRSSYRADQRRALS